MAGMITSVTLTGDRAQSGVITTLEVVHIRHAVVYRGWVWEYVEYQGLRCIIADNMSLCFAGGSVAGCKETP